MCNVLDVSHHQGTIDWAKVKAAGFWGVFIRAARTNSGVIIDEKFEENYAGAKAAGLNVGVYFASYDTSTGAAKRSAAAAAKLISGKQLELPVFYDFEFFATAQKSMSSSDCYEMVRQFCKTMENNGFFVGVYSSNYYLYSHLKFKELAKEFVVWVADWRENADYETVKQCCCWQYTNKGRVNGINTDVDLNYWYRSDIPNTIKNGGFNGFAKPGALYEVCCTVSKGDLDRLKALATEPGKEFQIFVNEVK